MEKFNFFFVVHWAASKSVIRKTFILSGFICEGNLDVQQLKTKN